MPLTTLLILVVFGIAGAVLLTHLFGWSARRTFADEVEALALYQADEPGAGAEAALLSDDRAVALIRTAQGPGVAATLGIGGLTRPAPRIEEARGGLRLRLDDPGAPAILFRTKDPAAARAFLEGEPK